MKAPSKMSRDAALVDSYWPADTSAPLLDTTLGALLGTLAAEIPDRIAFVEGDPDPQRRRRWTYRQLFDSSKIVARALLRRFEPGERVAVWSANCAEWVLLQHGAAMAGLALVTVNPAYVAAELEHVLATSRAAGIFHADGYRGSDMANVVRSIRGRLPWLRLALPFADWDDFVSLSDPSLELPLVQPRDMIQIQFTSGTTGKPKGACLHHKGVINAARFAARRAGFQEAGVWATAMPLFHVGGCAGSEIGAFSMRGTFVLQPAFDAGVMLELIESERVRHLHAVPTMLVAMLEHSELQRRDVSSLKTIMSGGSSVPPELVRRASETFNCRFTITFGQTELNGVVCQTRPDDEPKRQSTTIGQPAPQMEVKIADPHTGAVRALGEPGEIWARGYQTMLGYFDEPENAETALRRDGWLKTGDQATMDAQGYLRVTGRLKDCIIRGGENIYPREVEEVLGAHPLVRQAAVVGIADEKWGEVVAAVIAFRADMQRPPAIDLHLHCRAHLASYKTPAVWIYVDELPATSSGKIQKFILRERIRDGALIPEPFVKPSRDGIRA